LIDPLAITSPDLAPLAAVLADPAVIIVMHGADYDLRVLNRDLGASVRGVRDTQAAAQLLGEEQTGLAALLEKYLGVTLDKRFQRADWSQRPLPMELLGYAANDTAHLGVLVGKLERLLRSAGRLDWWIEECTALERIRWEAPEPDDLAFDRVKGASRLHREARDRLAALFRWREEIAAERDVAPFRVVRNEVLLAVAEAGASTPKELAELPGVGQGIVRRWGRGILDALRDVPQAPARPVKPRFELDRAREERIRRLRQVRDEAANELALSAGLLAPRTLLEAIVDEPPAGEQELARLLQRKWRARVLAPAVLPLAASWALNRKSGGAAIS